MRRAASRGWWTLLAPLLMSCAGRPLDLTVAVDTTQRYQVLTGWEAHVQSGHTQANWEQISERVLDLAADSVGINRIRLEVKASTENHRSVVADLRSGRATNYRCHRWRNENDNADPNVFDWTGFQFDAIDEDVEKVILPLKRRLEARGRRLSVNLIHTAFIDHCGYPLIPYVHADAEEYAELMLATMIHLRDKYQLVPEVLEIVLEPDNTPMDGAMIGRALVATQRRLRAAGFNPAYAAPSASHADRTMRYVRPMLEVPGAREVLTDLIYHRYDGGTGTHNTIDSLRRLYGWRTGMLEWIAATHEHLEEDLLMAGASSWQQFTLAFPERDNGAQYIVIEGNTARLASRTRFLRHYFLHLPQGSQRVEAGGRTGDVTPLAFVRPDSGMVLVVSARRTARVRFSGLRPGRYMVWWSTENDEGRAGPLPADSVVVRLPSRGVATVFPAR